MQLHTKFYRFVFSEYILKFIMQLKFNTLTPTAEMQFAVGFERTNTRFVEVDT
jgi:hypothetical protein